MGPNGKCDSPQRYPAVVADVVVVVAAAVGHPLHRQPGDCLAVVPAVVAVAVA